MIRKIATVLAILLLVGVCAAFLATIDERDRVDYGNRQLASGWESAPSLSCPTGRDRDGRCVGRNLMGGVHSFVPAGLAAALLAGLGGGLAGLGGGYAPQPISGITRALLRMLESLPRLAILLLIYRLFDHSIFALGVALGLLSIPQLAEQIFARIEGLEQTDFIRSARAHGMGERRVVWHHILFLSCRGDIIRHVIVVFGNMLVAETSLSYALQSNLSTTEWSWGYQLHRATQALYEAVYSVSAWLTRLQETRGVGEQFLGDGTRQGGGQTASFADALEYLWTHGIPQFLCVVFAILAVLWATHYLGEWAARAADRIDE